MIKNVSFAALWGANSQKIEIGGNLAGFDNRDNAVACAKENNVGMENATQVQGAVIGDDNTGFYVASQEDYYRYRESFSDCPVQTVQGRLNWVLEPYKSE